MAAIPGIPPRSDRSRPVLETTFISNLKHLMSWAESHRWEFYQYRPWGYLFSELCRQARSGGSTITSACQHPFLRMRDDVALPKQFADRDYCVADFTLMSFLSDGSDLNALGTIFFIAELKSLSAAKAPWDCLESRAHAAYEIDLAEPQMELQALLAFARHPEEKVLYSLAISAVAIYSPPYKPIHMFSLPDKTQLNPWLRLVFKGLARETNAVPFNAFDGSWFELQAHESSRNMCGYFPPHIDDVRRYEGNSKGYQLPSKTSLIPAGPSDVFSAPIDRGGVANMGADEARALANSQAEERDIDQLYHQANKSNETVIEPSAAKEDGGILLEESGELPTNFTGLSIAQGAGGDAAQADRGVTDFEKHTLENEDTHSKKRPVTSPESGKNAPKKAREALVAQTRSTSPTRASSKTPGEPSDKMTKWLKEGELMSVSKASSSAGKRSEGGQL
ncbi:hypothetical protein EIP91_004783 [Steccherinum ochraceum]|uniref:Uncharacterized protein n=1 Tax=Steccherinum ochraceum TaxID=92696 RepID=A0A4R0RNI0_9APHY|nr:hypothetical protein EIP91_004783 [Steccherinum ochraceum]